MTPVRKLLAVIVVAGALFAGTPSRGEAQQAWDCYNNGQCSYIAACWGEYAWEPPCSVVCWIEVPSCPPFGVPCYEQAGSAECGNPI
jgi:hypothetical protein